MGRGRPRSKHKYVRVKVQNDIHINKQLSPIFNCVTPENVSLASLACQLFITALAKTDLVDLNITCKYYNVFFFFCNRCCGVSLISLRYGNSKLHEPIPPHLP